MLEQYQDIWVNGKLAKKGVRECENRYKLIKKFCEQYNRPFTVLDIGANLGYFSLRLMEDFDCTVVMVESPRFYASRLKKILKQNDVTRGILLETHVDIPTMQKLSEVEHFDVVLAMSVIHHIPGDLRQVYESLKLLGDNLIIEVPVEKNACNPRGVSELNFIMGNLLGRGKSHLEKTTRPIYHVECNRRPIKKPYLRFAWRFTPPIVISNFNMKVIDYMTRSERRPWVRGINLWTYWQMNGTYPSRSKVIDLVDDYDFGEHYDIRPWNVILQGETIVAIDQSMERSVKYDPLFAKAEVLSYLRGETSTMKDMTLR